MGYYSELTVIIVYGDTKVNDIRIIKSDINFEVFCCWGF